MDEPIATIFPSVPEGPTLDHHPRGFTVVAGEPSCTTWRYYAQDDGTVLTASGLWQCTTGTFRFRYEHWEFFHVVQGVLVVTAENGPPRRLGIGDAMVMEPGFAGTWEVVETMRKHFVTRYVRP